MRIVRYYQQHCSAGVNQRDCGKIHEFATNYACIWDGKRGEQHAELRQSKRFGRTKIGRHAKIFEDGPETYVKKWTVRIEAALNSSQTGHCNKGKLGEGESAMRNYCGVEILS